ncbi:MAG: hypothetical protein OCC46_02660 [Pseudodesulfovibrio sp.]
MRKNNTMFFSFKGSEFDATAVMIFVTPLLALLCLTLILAFHNETLTAESSFNDERFIVMPRNCYLKTP